jgi:peptide deformylase
VTVRPILITGEPVLHAPTRPFDDDEFGSEELRTLVDDLFDTMDAAHGVGLAANQVGVGRRVFVYDCPDPELDGERRRGVVVNPTLETGPVPETMPDEDDDAEGCLSVPGENFPTGRADWARVTGRDVEGAPVEVEGVGFFARCLQHETDHLDGHVYLDRLVGRNRRAAKRAVRDHGWGVPGLSWMPGVDPDPFGH